MKCVEIRILFKNGVRENYILKKENLDYEDVNNLKDFIMNIMKNEWIGAIELESLKTGFESVINISEISEAQFGKIHDC